MPSLLPSLLEWLGLLVTGDEGDNSSFETIAVMWCSSTGQRISTLGYVGRQRRLDPRWGLWRREGGLRDGWSRELEFAGEV